MSKPVTAIPATETVTIDRETAAIADIWVAKDASRPVLQALFMDGKTASVCDGYAATRVAQFVPEGADRPHPVMIRATDLWRIMKSFRWMKGQSKVATLTSPDSQTYRVEGPNGESLPAESFVKDEVSFPDIGMLFPRQSRDDRVEVALNPEFLERIAKTAKLVDSSRVVLSVSRPLEEGPEPAAGPRSVHVVQTAVWVRYINPEGRQIESLIMPMNVPNGLYL